jgi:hypothetical protein
MGSSAPGPADEDGASFWRFDDAGAAAGADAKGDSGEGCRKTFMDGRLRAFLRSEGGGGRSRGASSSGGVSLLLGCTTGCGTNAAD